MPLLGDHILLRANFWKRNFGSTLFEAILRVKFHSGTKRILGNKHFWKGKVWGAKIMGANFWEQKKNNGRKKFEK